MKKLIAKLFVVASLLSTGTVFAAPAVNVNNATSPEVKAAVSADAGYFRISSHSYRYHRVWLSEGTHRIVLSGDGDTDLDLYVYDSHGMIAYSNDSGDDESVSITVYRASYFTIQVDNDGSVYNDYLLSVS